jgi:hypothetical protein
MRQIIRQATTRIGAQARITDQGNRPPRQLGFLLAREAVVGNSDRQAKADRPFTRESKGQVV